MLYLVLKAAICGVGLLLFPRWGVMLGMNTGYHWVLGIAVNGATWGVFGVAVSLTLAVSTNSALAQITPDKTLTNNSTVRLDGNTHIIEGGTRTGGNLFHSFGQFSVRTGETAHFNNAADVQNIFGRVTGGLVSNIDGLMKANGIANLFLINPNGIIFGKNASLNIGGSFVATTANAIQFGQNSFFSATNPNTPELLTVNPSAFFFNQIAAASIQNNSVAPAGPAPFGGTSSGLRVRDGKSLLLVGGDIQMDGGRLRAYGGRVELGGLTSKGTVGLQVDGNNLSLSFPAESTRADVSLTNKASVRVDAGDGGSIAVNARNLDILGGSSLTAGIGQGLGSVGSQAGDVTLDATGAVMLADSNIYNIVSTGAVGSGGNINIRTGSVSLTNSAQLQTTVFGRGKAGNVNIDARDNVLIEGDGTFIYSIVNSGGKGNGGNLSIKAGNLSIRNGAEVQTSVFGINEQNAAGIGDAGDVNINVRDAVTIAGGGEFLTGVFSTLGSQSVGKGGNINITSGSLSLTNGAQLQTQTLTQAQGNAGEINIKTGTLSTNGAQLLASTSGQGNAGNVNIDARDLVSFDHSSAKSNVEQTGIGKGGDIRISTGALSLTNGAQLQTSTLGRGNAGNVSVQVGSSLSIVGDSGIYSLVDSGAVGSGGNIRIQAGSLSLDGDPSFAHTAQVATGTYGTGDSGNIYIKAGSVSLANKAYLGSEVNDTGRGNAGNILMQVDNAVSVSNFSFILNGLRPGGVGNGGDIDIQARSLSLTQSSLSASNGAGAAVDVTRGNAGNIRINATDFVNISGVLPIGGAPGGLFTNAEPKAIGGSGNITVTTGALHISNGATLSAESTNAYSGGNITVDANTLELASGGKLQTSAFSSGNAGNIIVNVTGKVNISGSDPTFFDRFNQVASSKGEQQAKFVVGLANPASGLFANTDNNSTGKGGNIKLNTGQLQIQDGAQVTTSSQGTGDAGNIKISARSLKLDNGFITTTSRRSGTGGNIDNLQVQHLLLLRNHSQISTSASTDQNGGGNGGNININAPLIVAVPKEDSDISANAFKGNGGNIQITTSGIFGIQYRPQDTQLSDITASSQFGVNGTVQINTLDVDPSRGLVALPLEVVDAARLIDQNFCAATAGTGSSFTITGRGGLPPSPNAALNSNAVWEDWRLTGVPHNHPTPTAKNFQPISPKHTTSEPIVPATGWVKNERGEIELTANPPTVTPHSPWLNPPSCHTSG